MRSSSARRQAPIASARLAGAVLTGSWHGQHTWTVGSLLNSASSDFSILESLSSSRRYQNVCIADSGQLMRVSTCAARPPVRPAAIGSAWLCAALPAHA